MSAEHSTEEFAMDRSQRVEQPNSEITETSQAREPNVGYRLASLVAVFLVLAFGTAQRAQSGPGKAVADPQSQVQAGAGPSDCFPTQYVNRGTTVEAHIQAY
jgi:hypothetical protein